MTVSTLQPECLEDDAINRACAKLFPYLTAREHSARGTLKKIKQPVPGFSLQETKDRVSRKHLQNNRREDDPTTQKCTEGLRKGFDEMKATGASDEDCKRALLTTWAVWRLGGNTVGWFSKVGFLQNWSRDAKARLRFLWIQGLTDSNVGMMLFHAGLKPASFLHHGAVLPKDNHEFMVSWEKVEQILDQIETLRDNVFPTLYALSPACLNWREYARMLSGVLYFGTSTGPPGYT